MSKGDNKKTPLITRNQIIGHRGLDPDVPNFPPENSYEALSIHIKRCGGIEFDPCFAKDSIVVVHDNNLDRPTNRQDKRAINNLTLQELRQVRVKYEGGIVEGRIPTLDEVLNLIVKHGTGMSALHFKGPLQTVENINRLAEALEKRTGIFDKMLIFDVKAETARALKRKLPKAKLVPSVAHLYDIKRFNKAVNGTLITLDEAIKFKKEGIIWGVWLDEWDLEDENGGKKQLYTKEVFERARAADLWIGLVTPELHGTSPGLYGGESHPDAKPTEKLMSRIAEIAALRPDGICTDYPEKVSKV